MKGYITKEQLSNSLKQEIDHKINIEDLDYVDVKNPPIPFTPAIGDGVSDDTIQIQTLIDNFDNVLISSGIYLVSTLNLEKGKHVFGNGKQNSILKGNFEGLNIINCVCGQEGYEQYKIHDLTIDGSSISNHAVYINRTTSSTHDTWANIYHVHIKNCKGDGLYLGNQIRECYIDTLEISGCQGNGLVLEEGATDNVITNVVSHNNEKSGFYINGANNRFIGCKAYWNGRNNNAEQEERCSGFYITKYTNKFTCCDAQENALHGFHICDTKHIVIEGMSADRNGLPLTDWKNSSPQVTYGSGVYIENSSLIEIRGLCKDFLKWTLGQTQKYGVTSVSSNNIVIDIQCLDVEKDLNLSSSSSYYIRVNGVEKFHNKIIPSLLNKNNYFLLEDTSSVMGTNVYNDKSRFQIYSNNNNEIKIDSYNKNSTGDFQWTGTPLKINNAGDIHLGRYNTKIGFFDVEGINRIQAPTAASDLDTVITLANNLRQILIDYGLLG